MTDRELLELAAKVYGIDLIAHSDGIRFNWNPLKYDGDAFRLAVSLGFDVMVDQGTHHKNMSSVVFPIQNDYDGLSEPQGEDKFAATRRVIVRAAAEIGRRINGGGNAN